MNPHSTNAEKNPLGDISRPPRLASFVLLPVRARHDSHTTTRLYTHSPAGWSGATQGRQKIRGRRACRNASHTRHRTPGGIYTASDSWAAPHTMQSKPPPKRLFARTHVSPRAHLAGRARVCIIIIVAS